MNSRWKLRASWHDWVLEGHAPLAARAVFAALAVLAAAFAATAGATPTAAAQAAPATPAATAATSATTAPRIALGATATPYGWVLQLRGALSRDLTSRQFAALAARAGVGARWTDGSSNVWAGVPLWRLVGLVDDRSPATFSKSLAAKGYFVQVVALDGTTVTLKSTDKLWAHVNGTLVADLENGAPLAFGTVDGSTWLPGWPCKIAGAKLTATQAPGGVVKIIVSRPGVKPPAKPAVQPGWILQVRGQTSVDATAAQFRALAKAHPATWTDTSVTPNVPYTGTPLARLVALVDGGSPTSLNLDWLGLGYKVDVTAMGLPAAATTTIDSAALAGGGVIVADRQGSPPAPLSPTQGKLVQQPDTSWTWTPTWPARLAGSGLTSGQSLGGLLRVVVNKPTVPSYLPPLHLVGRRTAKVPYLDFPVDSSWNGHYLASWKPVFDATYQGAPISQLVGLVDDSNPKSFNVKLARKGYKIELIAGDGYSWTLSSKTIVGQKHWIVASLKDGKPLPYVAGDDSENTEAPYRFVGSFIHPFYGRPSVFQLVEIKLIF